MSRLKKGGAIAGLTGACAAICVPFVSGWEGTKLRAYRDIVGVATICSGETRGVKMGQTATKAERDAMLLKGLGEFQAGVFGCAPGLANDKPERQVAHISLAYNVGVGGYCKSTVARRYNAGDVRGSCDAFLMWSKAGGKVVAGLVRRRQAERELCLK